MNIEIVNNPEVVENLRDGRSLWIAPDGTAYKVPSERHQWWCDTYISHDLEESEWDDGHFYTYHLEDAGWVHISYNRIVRTVKATREQRHTLEAWLLLNKFDCWNRDDNHDKCRKMGVRVPELI